MEAVIAASVSGVLAILVGYVLSVQQRRVRAQEDEHTWYERWRTEVAERRAEVESYEKRIRLLERTLASEVAKRMGLELRVQELETQLRSRG